jgi:hypothetical protein
MGAEQPPEIPAMLRGKSVDTPINAVAVSPASNRRSIRSRVATVVRAICCRTGTRLSISAGYRPPGVGSTGVSGIGAFLAACGHPARQALNKSPTTLPAFDKPIHGGPPGRVPHAKG